MKYNILIILIISLFVNQLRAACPAGSQDINGSDQVADADIANCTMCKPNFYHSGNPPFAAGNPVTGICTECPKHRAGSQAVAGANATLVNQCDVTCPSGTVLDGGQASYVNSPQQCSNCAANHYLADPNAFNAGVSECLPCPVNLDVGAVQSVAAQATIARQCNVACPAGTSTVNGQNSYTNQSSECANCRANTYFSGPNNFNAGTSVCTPCPAGGNKQEGAVAKPGNEASITAQCNVLCPKNTVTNAGVNNWVVVNTECTNCAANSYYSGPANFAAGNTECQACPINKEGGKLNPGSNATLATQCNVQCPAGTVLDDGTTQNYVNLATECTKCAANFYQSKATGLVAGTDTCTECTKKLTSGAQAKLLSDATQKVQCSSQSFAKFLSMSLIFISFYLL